MGLMTSPEKIELAKKFITLGCGDAIKGEKLPFRSLDFLTDLLTTAKVQAILPTVSTYINFDGNGPWWD